VEAADDICYAIIDLEDAVELRILSFERVESLLLSPFDEQERARIRSGFAPISAHRVNLARLRGPVFDLVVSGAIDGFMKGYERIMEGDFDGDIFDLLDDNDPRKSFISRAKDLAKTHVFLDQKKVEVDLGSYSTFECLLDAFCRAAVDRAQHLKSPRSLSDLLRHAVI
jgi:dGTPase